VKEGRKLLVDAHLTPWKRSRKRLISPEQTISTDILHDV